MATNGGKLLRSFTIWIILVKMITFSSFVSSDPVEVNLENPKNKGIDLMSAVNMITPSKPVVYAKPPPVKVSQVAGREQFSELLGDAGNVIPKGYSLHVPPPADSEENSTAVGMIVYVWDIRNIDEVRGEISIELNLQIEWKDTRFSHLGNRTGQRFIVLNPILIDQIWHPGIYIDHWIRVEQPKLVVPTVSLRIYNDSTIRYSSRMTIVLACKFDYRLFPSDTQECPMAFKSYYYSDVILRLYWRETQKSTVGMNPKLELHNFDAGVGNIINFTVPTLSGDYSAISYSIFLERHISFYIVQIYIPSGLMVLVAWLSFWLPPDYSPARMSLCTTTLLAVSTSMFILGRQNSPNVSYFRVLDIWMLGCTVFVVSALVEYAIVIYVQRLKPKPTPPTEHNILLKGILQTVRKMGKIGGRKKSYKIKPGVGRKSIPQSIPLLNSRSDSASDVENSTPIITPQPVNYHRLVEKIEACMRICFLLCFIICCIIYFMLVIHFSALNSEKFGKK